MNMQADCHSLWPVLLLPSFQDVHSRNVCVVQVTEVVLVERTDARVSQAAATRLMLAAIAPSARFTLLLADGG